MGRSDGDERERFGEEVREDRRDDDPGHVSILVGPAGSQKGLRSLIGSHPTLTFGPIGPAVRAGSIDA